jgi:hypothetical protein
MLFCEESMLAKPASRAGRCAPGPHPRREWQVSLVARVPFATLIAPKVPFAA